MQRGQQAAEPAPTLKERPLWQTILAPHLLLRNCRIKLGLDPIQPALNHGQVLLCLMMRGVQMRAISMCHPSSCCCCCCCCRAMDCHGHLRRRAVVGMDRPNPICALSTNAGIAAIRHPVLPAHAREQRPSVRPRLHEELQSLAPQPVKTGGGERNKAGPAERVRQHRRPARRA